jgi:hypothetical protein
MGMKQYAKSDIQPNKYATKAQLAIDKAGEKVADMERMKKGGDSKTKKKN